MLLAPNYVVRIRLEPVYLEKLLNHLIHVELLDRTRKFTGYQKKKKKKKRGVPLKIEDVRPKSTFYFQ